MIRWYVVPCIVHITPEGEERYTTTAGIIEQHIGSQIIDGVESRLYYTKKKYPGMWSAAYLEAAPPFSVALLQTDSIIFDSEDIIRELITNEDWIWLQETYPALVGRFENQPVAEV